YLHSFPTRRSSDLSTVIIERDVYFTCSSNYVIVGHNITVFRNNYARTRTDLFSGLSALIAIKEFHNWVSHSVVTHIFNMDDSIYGFIYALSKIGRIVTIVTDLM